MYSEELERAWSASRPPEPILDDKIERLDRWYDLLRDHVIDLEVKLKDTQELLAIISIGWIISTLIFMFLFLA